MTISHPLCVIAGAGCDDAAQFLFGRQQRKPVERAALLEGTGHLQVFKLQEDVMPRKAGDRLRTRERRVLDLATYPTARREYIFEPNRQWNVHAVKSN
jgi:hypothetical protein